MGPSLDPTSILSSVSALDPQSILHVGWRSAQYCTLLVLAPNGKEDGTLKRLDPLLYPLSDGLHGVHDCLLVDNYIRRICSWSADS